MGEVRFSRKFNELGLEVVSVNAEKFSLSYTVMGFDDIGNRLDGIDVAGIGYDKRRVSNSKKVQISNLVVFGADRCIAIKIPDVTQLNLNNNNDNEDGVRVPQSLHHFLGRRDLVLVGSNAKKLKEEFSPLQVSIECTLVNAEELTKESKNVDKMAEKCLYANRKIVYVDKSDKLSIMAVRAMHALKILQMSHD